MVTLAVIDYGMKTNRGDVMLFSRPAGHIFVDRGDPTAVDFMHADLIIDSQWHDLDLSGIIPKGTKRVDFRILATSISIPKMLEFKTKGNMSGYNISKICTQVASIAISHDLNVVPNADGIIQYRIDEEATLILYMTISGWFI